MIFSAPDKQTLFGKTYKPAHSSAPQVNEINKLDQINEEFINVSTHIPLKALVIHLKRVKWRGVVFVNQCSNTFNCARDVHHKKCGLGSYNISTSQEDFMTVTVSFYSKFQ